MAQSTIKIPSYNSGAFDAYIAMPEVTPAPAVIVIQEIFGINQDIRDKCDELAAQGYIAIAPDLFWRIEPNIELVDSIEEQLQRAFELFQIFDEKDGNEDLKTTLGYMRNHKACNGKVGAVGYCLGGKLAYALSASSDIDASVSYYGVGLQDMLGHADNIDTPLMMHIAENDEYVPKDAQNAIIEKFKDHNFGQTHSYDGLDHAFARLNGTHYNKDGANQANQRTTDFLKTHLK